MGKLLGAKSINTANGVRRGALHAERNGLGRIIGVTLSVEGVGMVSFAHIVPQHYDGNAPLNAAERLEALRGSACPMSGVRLRRYERGNETYNETAGI